MEKEELRLHIEKIINETFITIDNLYKTNRECPHNGHFVSRESRLVFPKYRGKEEVRLSEQEIRFLFIEKFNKYCSEKKLNLFYSIETPSEERYNFSQRPKKHCSSKKDKGESAQFDMVIYDESKERVCLIEFKNNKNDAGEYEKDFLKLSVEGSDDFLCYFISIAESSNSGTIGEKSDTRGIIPKFKSFKNNNEISFNNITYICHCINNRGKGFDTIYAGTVKGDFKWKEKSELFEK